MTVIKKPILSINSLITHLKRYLSVKVSITNKKALAPFFSQTPAAMSMGAEATNQSHPQNETMTDDIQAFLEAARYADIDDVVSLVSVGVPLDSKDSEGRTALHMAAANGHLDIVDYLIKNGADLNACNAEKNTPLHWACLNGHKEVVRILILGGADATKLNSHERTPLDEAVSRGKMDVVEAIDAAVASRT